MNDKKAMEIFEECIDEMYRNCTPPITWDYIKKNYSGTKTTFYSKYTISDELYTKIKNKYAKKLDNYYKSKLDWFLLDFAPMSGRK
jgi:hypothetical protein